MPAFLARHSSRAYEYERAESKLVHIRSLLCAFALFVNGECTRGIGPHKIPVPPNKDNEESSSRGEEGDGAERGGMIRIRNKPLPCICGTT